MNKRPLLAEKCSAAEKVFKNGSFNEPLNAHQARRGPSRNHSEIVTRCGTTIFSNFGNISTMDHLKLLALYLAEELHQRRTPTTE
ncbi:hypothetical protein pipiens_011982 [Culex pipiens pipiens]|uniref:Uncharacterized protein n=1 Tax=Culex pipiens pipiens TaxID=38569 RepID=A0ABD1D485_CULPP